MTTTSFEETLFETLTDDTQSDGGLSEMQDAIFEAAVTDARITNPLSICRITHRSRVDVGGFLAGVSQIFPPY